MKTDLPSVDTQLRKERGERGREREREREDKAGKRPINVL